MFVFLHRYLVVDALMAATVVVILDVVPNALSQARHVVLRVDIDILRLDGTPEALYPDVVLAASTAIWSTSMLFPLSSVLCSPHAMILRLYTSIIAVKYMNP